MAQIGTVGGTEAMSADNEPFAALPAHGGSTVDLADLEAAFRTEYVALCRVARLLVDDGGRAEELVQDCFARTVAARDRIDEVAALPAYLRRAVVRACHSDLRRRRVERRLGLGWASRPLTDDVGGGRDAAEALVSSVAMRAALGSLPPRQRATVVLHYYADLDQAEVARTLGCSVGTVKSQLSKARSHLANLIDDGGLSQEEDHR